MELKCFLYYKSYTYIEASISCSVSTTKYQLGPEGAVINEMEGRAPQKIIADVMLTCEEDFVLEDATGKVVHRDSSGGPKVISKAFIGREVFFLLSNTPILFIFLLRRGNFFKYLIKNFEYFHISYESSTVLSPFYLSHRCTI